MKFKTLSVKKTAAAADRNEIVLPYLYSPSEKEVLGIYDLLIRDAYAGSFLLWKTDSGDYKNFDGTKAEKGSVSVVLDGVKRLCALYAGVRGLVRVTENGRKVREMLYFDAMSGAADYEGRRDYVFAFFRENVKKDNRWLFVKDVAALDGQAELARYLTEKGLNKNQHARRSAEILRKMLCGNETAAFVKYFEISHRNPAVAAKAYVFAHPELTDAAYFFYSFSKLCPDIITKADELALSVNIGREEAIAAVFYAAAGHTEFTYAAARSASCLDVEKLASAYLSLDERGKAVLPFVIARYFDRPVESVNKFFSVINVGEGENALYSFYLSVARSAPEKSL